nr:hypothetical protein [uncultured Shinella sp.]
MAASETLLQLAVENNVAWCRTICAAHSLSEVRTNAIWANLSSSPRYYPNIITTARGAQEESVQLIRRLRQERIASGWGIKDSYADLDLSEQGLFPLTEACWYGGFATVTPVADWKRVKTEAELRAWVNVWGNSEGVQFPSGLLGDPRIAFWYKGAGDVINAGFVTFDAGISVGISNWFSLPDQTPSWDAILAVAANSSHGRPLVLWSKDLVKSSLNRLGALRVWISD